MKIEVIHYNGSITPAKLKRYSKDPTIFVVFNAHKLLIELYARATYPVSNAPSYEECYKIRPFKFVYDKAHNSDNQLGLQSLCLSIEDGDYELIRIKED